MVVSASTSCIEFSNPFAGISSYCTINKAALIPVTAAILLALKVRLDTKPRGSYHYDNWQNDIVNLLNSYNVFDAASRATIMNFVDKYFVGYKFKKDEQTIRVRKEDGSVVTTKRGKVTQFPSGLMGLFDAYVLQQLEPNSKLLPLLAASYVLVNDPVATFAREITKAMKV
jgi:hypothetical protein